MSLLLLLIDRRRRLFDVNNSELQQSGHPVSDDVTSSTRHTSYCSESIERYFRSLREAAATCNTANTTTAADNDAGCYGNAVKQSFRARVDAVKHTLLPQSTDSNDPAVTSQVKGHNDVSQGHVRDSENFVYDDDCEERKQAAMSNLSAALRQQLMVDLRESADSVTIAPAPQLCDVTSAPVMTSQHTLGPRDVTDSLTFDYVDMSVDGNCLSEELREELRLDLRDSSEDLSQQHKMTSGGNDHKPQLGTAGLAHGMDSQHHGDDDDDDDEAEEEEGEYEVEEVEGEYEVEEGEGEYEEEEVRNDDNMRDIDAGRGEKVVRSNKNDRDDDSLTAGHECQLSNTSLHQRQQQQQAGQQQMSAAISDAVSRQSSAQYRKCRVLTATEAVSDVPRPVTSHKRPVTAAGTAAGTAGVTAAAGTAAAGTAGGVSSVKKKTVAWSTSATAAGNKSSSTSSSVSRPRRPVTAHVLTAASRHVGTSAASANQRSASSSAEQRNDKQL